MTTSLRSFPRRVVLGGIAASGAMLTLPGVAHVNRLPNLTPDRRPISTPLSGGF
jgi:hypothetical protein